MSCRNCSIPAKPWPRHVGAEVSTSRYANCFMSEELPREILKRLADADALAEARPEIEIRLRKAFHARRRKRILRETMVWAASVAAITLIFVSVIRRPEVVPAPPSSEVATDFFPLMDPAPPFQRGRILRVELPA